MTVIELIVLLETFDPDADVLVAYDGAPRGEIHSVTTHEREWDDEDDIADGTVILDTEKCSGGKDARKGDPRTPHPDSK